MHDTNSSNKRGYLNQIFKLFHLKDCEKIEFDYHHHDFCKVVIFISGKVTYIIEGKSYKLKPWDILLINHSQIHKPVISDDEVYERIIIWFDSNEIIKFNTKVTNLLECFEVAAKSQFSLMRASLNALTTLKNKISALNNEDKTHTFGNDILSNIKFLELLLLLNEEFLRQGKLCNEDIEYDERITIIIDYINNNLLEDLKIDELAKINFMSKYHLMRKFKLQTGLSIHNYIIQKRLILAKSYMASGKSMTEISHLSGFMDYSSFVRAFKKYYSVSPKQYYQKNFTLSAFEELSNTKE